MGIGMFSRSSLLSIKALRAYHQQGILVPAAVDPITGYRAYHPGQLADAAVLRRLRDLELPLVAVKEVLHARDPDVTAKVLSEHDEVMRARLARTEQIVADLQRALEAPAEETPVHLRASEHQHALAITTEVSASGFDTFFAWAHPTLAEAAAVGGFVVAGAAGALFEPEIADDDDEPVTAYLPVTAPGAAPRSGAGVSLVEIPARTLAVIVHRGTYGSMGDTYGSLGAWVAHHATPTGDRIREIYLVSAGDTNDPDAYRTEICWPVHSQEEP
jgi:DNA-binding transcriptional MerR regulator/effector-binding domain-containing protein